MVPPRRLRTSPRDRKVDALHRPQVSHANAQDVFSRSEPPYAFTSTRFASDAAVASQNTHHMLLTTSSMSSIVGLFPMSKRYTDRKNKHIIIPVTPVKICMIRHASRKKQKLVQSGVSSLSSPAGVPYRETDLASTEVTCHHSKCDNREQQLNNEKSSLEPRPICSWSTESTSRHVPQRNEGPLSG